MSEFTDEELELLSTTPSLIGSAISMSASSGVVGTVTEAMASAKGVLAGMKSYPDNKIIASVAPDVTDRAQMVEKAKDLKGTMKAKMAERGVKTKDDLYAMVIEDCGKVSEILKAKGDSAEAEQYKTWAMEIAEKVAMSAKEGGFMGFGGERVSDGERQAIADVANALGTKNPMA